MMSTFAELYPLFVYIPLADFHTLYEKPLIFIFIKDPPNVVAFLSRILSLCPNKNLNFPKIRRMKV